MDLATILKNLDQDLVRARLLESYFQELFFANCKCDKIAAAVKELLA